MNRSKNIICIEPISNADIEDIYTNIGNQAVDEINAMKGAVRDFIVQELKMTVSEINYLGIHNVTHNERQNNIKL